MNKSKLRNKILKLRKKKFLKSDQVSFRSIIRVLRKKKFKSKNIGGYYAYNYEMNIMSILEKFERLDYSVSLPKINKSSKMNFFHWSSNDPMKVNQYGIPEPVSTKKKQPDILLVPLLAYDANLNRIGYGGGFYDRYIARTKRKKKIITIGLAYSFQKVKKIPINRHDMKLDFVITEKDH